MPTNDDGQIKQSARDVPIIDVASGAGAACAKTVVILLSPGRSYSTVLSAMLGRHPNIHAFPELCILACDSMLEFMECRGARTFDGGLLRAAAQLAVRGSADQLASARAWVDSRIDRSTRDLFAELCRFVPQQVVIEKTPIYTASDENLARLERLFDQRARYVHVTRHPVAFAHSLKKTFEDLSNAVGLPEARRLAAQIDSLFAGLNGHDDLRNAQYVWLSRHERISRFLSTIPDARKIRVRGEDCVDDPERSLAELCRWMDLPCGQAELRAMKQSERWAYAVLGPPGFPRHGDRHFLRQPALRKSDPLQCDIDVPAEQAVALGSNLTSLARAFGYPIGDRTRP